MSNAKRERKRLAGMYDPLYTRHHGYESLPDSLGCFYCADAAYGMDHLPPLSWVETNTMEQWRRSGVEFLKVPCCVWCNSKLLSRPLFTLLERARFIERKLMDKYEREATLWSEEEIAEMSQEFQRTIRARKAATQDLLCRARAAEWRCIQESA